MVLNNEAVVTNVEKSPLPVTSNVNAGTVVLIPTFPPVVNILPIVLLFPVADNKVLAKTIPPDIFISTKLATVRLVTVKVPATFKFPERCAFPPLIVVALSNDAFTVPLLT